MCGQLDLDTPLSLPLLKIKYKLITILIIFYFVTYLKGFNRLSYIGYKKLYPNQFIVS